MLSCPRCKKQYGTGMIVCEVCGGPLVDSSPEHSTPDESAEGLELVELAEFSNVSEAEMIKELLEQNGIDSVVKGEVDPIGIASRAEPTTLLVEERDWGQAQEIYQAYFAGDSSEKEE
jgi:hypothetical protein